MSLPTISIIVPCYNCRNKLERCVLSLLDSTGVQLDIILADDGSTDGTGELCKHLSESYPGVSYLSLPHKGVSAARNAGLSAIKGSFVGFVDADDYVEPLMFQSLYAAIKDNDSVIAVCGFFRESDDYSESMRFEETKTISFEEFRFALFSDKRVEGFLFNKLFRSEVLKGHSFDEGLSVCEDLSFLAGISAPATSNVVYCPGAFYHYIQHSDSLTGGTDFFHNSVFRYAPAFTRLIKTADSKSLKRVIVQKYYLILRYSMSVTLKNEKASIEKAHILRLFRKELRRNSFEILCSVSSFKEKMSFIKAAYFPLKLIINEHRKRHSQR